jgi:phosphorylcholine metabolism protein LicD
MKKLTVIIISASIIISVVFIWYSFFSTEKFFKEPRGKPHYDKRYFRRVYSHKKIQDKLRIMYCVLIQFLDKYNVKCWLGFGTLLGYYRDKDIIPWDDDIDVSMMFDDLFKLPKQETLDNTYLWEVNPNVKPFKRDRNNTVSARLICMKTGIFVDVFANYIHGDKITDSEKNTWKVKDVFPLIETDFLGCSAYIPNNIKQVLIDYYGDISIPKSKMKEYQGYKNSLDKK